MSGDTCDAVVPMTQQELPEFHRIILELVELSGRLSATRERAVYISDKLIGVEQMHELKDVCAKPDTPDYFTSNCFDLIEDLRKEVVQLEHVNDNLLNHIQVG